MARIVPIMLAMGGLEANPGVFATTHWSVVLEARRGGDDRAGHEALERLCATYWGPLWIWARRSGSTAEDAEDLVQGFFESWLQRGSVKDVDPSLGRFRSFLLACFRNYILNVARDGRTQRRGSGYVPSSLDDPSTRDRHEGLVSEGAPADVAYDRAWAEDVVGRAVVALAREFGIAGRSEFYGAARRWLVSEARPGDYREAGERLGMSEGAIAVAVHRMRVRYRELVRAEVAQTVATPAEIEGEMRYLMSLLLAGR